MVNQEAHRPVKSEPRLFYGYIVVAISLLILVITYGARTSFGVFFKPMLTEFDWTRALTSGAFTVSMVMQGVFGIIMGRLNDRVGPRWVLTSCCFFSGLGFLLMSQTSHVWQLYLFYGVIIGLGAGGIFVALFSTVARWFVKKRGTMTGIVSAGIGVGTLVMSPLSNWLISIYNWRMSYIIVGVLVLVIGILASQFLKRDPTKMGLLPYGQNEVQEQKSASDTEGLSLKEAVFTGQFWMVSVVFATMGYSIFTVNIHVVPHITDLGISPATAANILAVSGGFQIIGGVLLGGAADRLGNRWALAISFILIAASILWLAPVREIWMFYLFAIIYGLGIGGGGAMEPMMVAGLFGMKSHGLILGVVSFVFTIGGAIGPVVTGYIFDVKGSYLTAFLVCGFIGVVGVILSAILKPPKKLSSPGFSRPSRLR